VKGETFVTRLLTIVIVILALAGVLTSALALGEHYNTKPSPCSINDKWDCGIVNHSPYAIFHDVPVALIGILGYALLAALAGRLPIITAIGAVAGLLFTLRLTMIEWKTLGVWCMYCVTSQGIIIAIAMLSLLAVGISSRTRSRA
jgi:uncharacterized membrane protein